MKLALVTLLLFAQPGGYVAPHRTVPVPPPGTVGVVRSAFGETRFDRGTYYGTFSADDAERQRVPATVATAFEAPPSPRAAPLAIANEASLPADPDALVTDTALETLINQHIDAWPGLEASVVVYDLVGFRRATVVTGSEMYPASIVKLALLEAAGEMITRGELPANRIVQLPPRALPVAELARKVGLGDHAAANVLLDLVTPARIAASARELGLPDTVLARGFNRPPGDAAPNRMPAQDAARLMYRLAREDLPPGVPKLLRELLPRPATGVRLGAAAGLAGAPEMRIVGFSGDASMKGGFEVKNDVALVESSGHRYVIAVYTSYEGDARAWIARLALAVHEALR